MKHQVEFQILLIHHLIKIKIIKAVESNISFTEGVQRWAYVLKPELYNKLSTKKVIAEAAVRSGISKAVLSASWGAIGDVICAWATEGHSVAVPGLGTMRFGLRSTSVTDVTFSCPSANHIANSTP